MKQYLNLYVKTLSLNDLLPFNVYIPSKSGLVLWRDKSTQVTQSDINKLLEAGVTAVSIEIEDRDKYVEYLESMVEEIVNDDGVPIEYKIQVIRDTSCKILDDLFTTPNDPRIAKRLEVIAGSIVQVIFEKAGALGRLLRKTGVDFSYSAHSTRTCYYTVALASKLKRYDRAGLIQLGLACLVHDIGQMAVPEAVREKIGAYSDQERYEMQKHPGYSVRFVKNSNISAFKECYLLAIEAHHELGDRTGYPNKVSLFDLPKEAQILVVTHTFESYTTEKIHRKAQRPVDVLKYMIEQPKKYPKDIILPFVMLLKNLMRY